MDKTCSGDLAATMERTETTLMLAACEADMNLVMFSLRLSVLSCLPSGLLVLSILVENIISHFIVAWYL